MSKIKVGIPRALHYYFFKDLWYGFFRELGIQTITSPETNKEIVRLGVALSVDEACFSSKLYLGHIEWLLDKCDTIFVPRIENSRIREDYCPRLIGVYDLVKHTFPCANLLHADVNYLMRKKESDAFVKIGEQLGFDAETSLKAYKTAVLHAQNIKDNEALRQGAKLNSDKLKVLVVSHSYNTFDAYIGKDILKYFNQNNIEVIFADVACPKVAKAKTRELHGNRIYWKVNSEILGGVELYKERVDGIVLISTFPCGPDSIFNEMIIRTEKNIPILSLMIDELDASAGIITRLESFTDILNARCTNANDKA